MADVHAPLRNQGDEIAIAETMSKVPTNTAVKDFSRESPTPLFASQELGGWETERMVRRYAHLSADHLAQWAGHAQIHGTFLAHPSSFLKLLDENVVDVQ